MEIFAGNISGVFARGLMSSGTSDRADRWIADGVVLLFDQVAYLALEALR